MSILDRLFGSTEKKGVPFSFFSNSGIMSTIVTKSDALDFYKSWVYACVKFRSMGIAKIDFKLYQLKGDEVVEVTEHELLNLLYKVNPEMTKFDFMQLSLIYRDLLGSSPWILEKTNPSDKAPSMMYLARPEFFTVKRDKAGAVEGYKYEIGTFKKEYTKEEVIFLKNYNPKNPDKGIGVVEAVRMTAENDDYILQSNNGLLKNGARPGGYFETDSILEDDERKKILKTLRKKWGGYENSYKVQILEGGLKFKSDLINPRDLEFMEGRKFNRDEIAGVFGVPKSLLTFDDVNLASAKSAEYNFNKWTLEPLAKEICEQLNEFLVPMFDDSLWLGFEPLATEDTEAVLKDKTESWNKWKTTNEIRAMEGLEPIEGGDYIYMPMSNMPTIGGESKSDVIVKIGGERKIGRVDYKTQKIVRKRILNRNFKTRKRAEEITHKIMAGFTLPEKKNVVLKIVEKKKTKERMTEESIRRFYAMRMAEEAKLEKKWKSEMQKFFKGQRGRFLESLEKHKKGLSEEMGISQTYEVNACIEVIEPLYYESVMAGARQASVLLGQEVENANLDFLMSWAKKVSAKIGEDITQTTIVAFDTSLREGIEAGESLSELTQRTKDIFTFANDTRAEMIARTETARAVSESHRQIYANYGYTKCKWLLAPNCCDACAELEAQTWTLESIKDAQPVHPNCKCDHFPIE